MHFSKSPRGSHSALTANFPVSIDRRANEVAHAVTLLPAVVAPSSHSNATRTLHVVVSVDGGTNDVVDDITLALVGEPSLRPGEKSTTSLPLFVVVYSRADDVVNDVVNGFGAIDVDGAVVARRL